MFLLVLFTFYVWYILQYSKQDNQDDLVKNYHKIEKYPNRTVLVIESFDSLKSLLKLIRNIAPFLSLLLLLQVPQARATLFFADHFSYTDGANLGSVAAGGGATWTLTSGDVSQIKIAGTAAQRSPTGLTKAAGFGIAVTPTGTRKQTGVPFNGVTGVPVGGCQVATPLVSVNSIEPFGGLMAAQPHKKLMVGHRFQMGLRTRVGYRNVEQLLACRTAICLMPEIPARCPRV